MTVSLAEKMNAAFGRFQARDLAGAERFCNDILGQVPNHPDALHLMGLVRLTAGRAGEAVTLLGRALGENPLNPDLLENLGVAHLAEREFVQAETVLRRALELGAGRSSLYMRLGLALSSQGKHDEAVAALNTAAEMAPGDPDIYLNLGNVLAGQGKLNEAIAHYDKVLALHPNHAIAHFNLGNLFRQMGQLEQAKSKYQAALAVDARFADAHHNLGETYQQEGRLDDAASCYRRVIALDLRHIHARNNLGNVLAAQGRFEDAEALYQAALQDRPDHPDAYVNLGKLRSEQRRYREAQALLAEAVRLDPASFDVHYGVGVALMAQGRWNDAAACFARSLELNPAFARAHYNLGLAQLFGHEFEQGWPGYEWRIERAVLDSSLRKDPAAVDLYERLPRWRGPQEAGVREVGIWVEQGIGDQVLFSTLIPELIASAVPFIFEVDRRLLKAYQRAFPGARFVAHAEPPQEALRGAERVLLAGSLPGLFRRSRASFTRQPGRLLNALPQRVAHYRGRLDELGPGLKAAFSWRSKRKEYIGPEKSAPLREFAPLLKLPGVQFVDVQYGDTAVERGAMAEATGVRLLRFDDVDYFNDLEEVLAILEACDLVITTSNAIAHFSGALGKRTWLLYLADNPPFHYWSHGGSCRSLWYPSVEIVSTPGLVEWSALIEHVAEKLARERT